MRRPIEKLLPVLALALPFSARAETAMAGLTVEELINRFSERGLLVYYSSDLVRSSMKVLAEPAAQSPVDSLREILLPHGLTLRPGFNDSWLVVRQPIPRRHEAANSVREAESPAPALDEIVVMPVEHVVVYASRYEIQGANAGSVRTLGDVDLEFSPDIGDDAIRAAARLPGMASNGFSALANVRGGEIGETLVRIDGLRLFDPFHLRDFQRIFSVIDPRVVESMDVYTGAYPVEFGDRMSGVIDVDTISAPDDLYHEVGVSFFNSSVLSAGRFASDRGDWVVSARRSNIDLLYDRFSEQPERPQYSDFFAKLGADLNDRTRITANVLRASDRIELADDIDREERATARQTDSYAWLRFDHSPGGQMNGVSLLSSAKVESLRSGTSEKLGVSSGWLEDRRSFSVETLRSEWSRIIGARLLLDFGGEVSRSTGRYDYEDAVDFDLLFDVDGAQSEPSRNRALSAYPRGRHLSVFATLRLDLGSNLSTEFGYRWGEQTIAGTSAATREPRLGVRYEMSEALSFRASAGRFFQVQGIDELQINDGQDEFFEPQQADHFVLGVDRRLPSGTMLRIEAFRKAMSHLRPRFENLLNARVLLPELKPDRVRIAPESAVARGIEVSVDGRSERFQWWGSAGWSRVEDRLLGRNVLRSWDQTYVLNAGMLWERDKWSFSSALAYRSGWPTTPVILDVDAAFPTASAAPRNSDRMRAYGSVDVRFGRRVRFDHSELNVFVELSNLSGRSNPCCIEYEIGDEEDLGLLVLDERSYLPTIPSIGFTWSF